MYMVYDGSDEVVEITDTLADARQICNANDGYILEVVTGKVYSLR